MAQVFLFHIDLTLTIAIVTENGRQYRLKYRKCHFGSQFGGLIDVFFVLFNFRREWLERLTFCRKFYKNRLIRFVDIALFIFLNV